MMNRRKFVTAGTAALVGMGFRGPFTRSSHAGALTEWFRAMVGTRVELQGDTWHTAELAALRESTSSPELEQFTLVFRLSPGDHVTEGIYLLTIGGSRGPIFFQPAGSDEAGSYCIATVSRLVDTRARRLATGRGRR